MIQCVDNVFSFFNDCFLYLFFIKQFKCCGLFNGAADWGNNFHYYYESCECRDMPDSSCIIYEGKTIYKQVRANKI